MLGDVRTVDPHPYQRREAREQVTRVFVGDLSEEKLERSDSLFVTETYAARGPLACLEPRNVPSNEPLGGLLGVRAAEDGLAHVRDVEEPVQDDDR
jgi:hypothetical protein